jgi:hypothetical protein
VILTPRANNVAIHVGRKFQRYRPGPASQVAVVAIDGLEGGMIAMPIIILQMSARALDPRERVPCDGLVIVPFLRSRSPRQRAVSLRDERVSPRGSSMQEGLT